MKRRDLIKRLTEAGFVLLRDDGDHTVYGKPDSRRVAVPRHREVDERTAKAILKAAGLQ